LKKEFLFELEEELFQSFQPVDYKEAICYDYSGLCFICDFDFDKQML